MLDRARLGPQQPQLVCRWVESGGDERCQQMRLSLAGERFARAGLLSCWNRRLQRWHINIGSLFKFQVNYPLRE